MPGTSGFGTKSRCVTAGQRTRPAGLKIPPVSVESDRRMLTWALTSPLWSSALLISSGPDLCCIESPFGTTESEDRQTALAATCWRCRSDRSRTAGEVQFGPWPLAGDAPSLSLRAGPGRGNPRNRVCAPDSRPREARRAKITNAPVSGDGPDSATGLGIRRSIANRTRCRAHDVVLLTAPYSYDVLSTVADISDTLVWPGLQESNRPGPPLQAPGRSKTQAGAEIG